VGDHHAKGFLNSQVKGTMHELGDVPAERAEATRHRALGLHFTLLDPWHASRVATRSSSSSC
jgi:hypothetical protein